MSVRPAATRRVRRAALVVLALATVGCSQSTPPRPPPPPCTDCSDNPQHTMVRFQAAYQSQDATVYRTLLTADFRYTFSSQADPALVALYGPNWGKDDEGAAAEHLLSGFTNSKGDYLPAARSINLTFTGDQYLGDPAHADSAAFYDFTPVAVVNLDIEIPDSGSTATYTVRAPHDFYLVRGDAAHLDAGQPADSLHWYIRRWDEFSTTLSDTSEAPGIHAVSWGLLKARYR